MKSKRLLAQYTRALIEEHRVAEPLGFNLLREMTVDLAELMESVPSNT